MTRSTIRLAQICAAAAAAGLLVAALAQSTAAGLAYTDRLLVVVGAAGAAASLGWHGVRILLERCEELRRAERRHRVPRLDRLPVRPPSAPRPPTTSAGAADAYPNPYAIDAADWPEPGPARVDPYEDLYAHHPVSST